ncbi:hypothetical protein HXY33_04540 [Candidatus Bathyarchaeota archaeon]|nr:hypothetical protein [Candidatus Bathyarchaeota archaeon]
MSLGKGYRNLIIGIIIIAVVIVVLVIPMIPVEESYNETEPYNRLATYDVVSATLTEGWDLVRGTYHTSTIVLRNTDAYGGTFSVTHRLYDINGLYDIETTTAFVGSGQQYTFSTQFDTQWLQDVRGEYSVSAPTVIDTRVVTKQRTVYKSIIQLLFYR